MDSNVGSAYKDDHPARDTHVVGSTTEFLLQQALNFHRQETATLQVIISCPDYSW